MAVQGEAGRVEIVTQGEEAAACLTVPRAAFENLAQGFNVALLSLRQHGAVWCGRTTSAARVWREKAAGTWQLLG